MGILQTGNIAMTLLTNGTLSERLKSASLNTLIGLGTVFAILVLMIILISFFKIIPYLQGRSAKQAEENVDLVDNVISQIVEHEEISLAEDCELVAVITAAIHASMGDAVPADGLVVRSIRKVKSKGWRNA